MFCLQLKIRRSIIICILFEELFKNNFVQIHTLLRPSLYSCFNNQDPDGTAYRLATTPTQMGFIFACWEIYRPAVLRLLTY